MLFLSFPDADFLFITAQLAFRFICIDASHFAINLSPRMKREEAEKVWPSHCLKIKILFVSFVRPDVQLAFVNRVDRFQGCLISRHNPEIIAAISFMRKLSILLSVSCLLWIEVLSSA